MSKENTRRNIVEKKNTSRDKDQKLSSTQNLLSKHLKKVYPVGIHKTSSLLSLSSLSLTLSHNSSGSFTDSSSTLEQTISSALQLIAPAPAPTPALTPARREVPAARTTGHGLLPQPSLDPSNCEDGLRRCNWITLRTPKAEAISKDLLKHGFRLVGPVIVYSFMQAAGMSIDHLVDCFRFSECVNLAERPWRHV